MINEFAIEPEALSEINMVWQALEQFGVPHGRLISEFPRRWMRDVYDATSGCPPIQRSKLEIRLQRLRSKLVRSRNGRKPDPAHTWRQKAHAEDANEPFHAIIQLNNDEGHERVLTPLDLTDDNAIWNVATERPVPRTPTALAEALGPLGRISKELLFVDPHFANEQWWSSVLLAALNECNTAALGHKRIEFHTGQFPDRRTLEASVNQYIAPRLSRSISIRFVLWEQKDSGEKMHARYFLTERGGIRFDFGLDAGAPGETTDVGLMSEELYAERWANYQNETAAYKKVDEFVVTGRV
jgi:hypothetical protein